MNNVNMQKSRPKISVVLPVFNGEDFIEKAIISVLNQNFSDFEFIIFNDGSTDGTESIIRGFSDPRIKYHARKNKGLVATLNEAITLCQSDIIARHDADDISDPDRFSKQLELLNNGNILVGSSIKTMDHQGKIINTHYVLTGNNTLKQELLVRSPFAHGSVMFSKRAFLDAGGYQESDWPAEDYGLWVRMASFGSFQNLHEPLYQYRHSRESISHLNSDLQQKKANQIANMALSNSELLHPFRSLETQISEPLKQRQYDNVILVLQKSISGNVILTLTKQLTCAFISRSILQYILYNSVRKLWKKNKHH